MVSAQEARLRLEQGNRRFVAGDGSAAHLDLRRRREELVQGQGPFAAVLACADSRVPPEIVFDQGLGDLFVVRVAGNVAAESQIASIEFAVSQFDVKLVVVLGHSFCGAVMAALEILDVEDSADVASHPLYDSIREAVRPAVALSASRDVLLERAVVANARHSADCLLNGSALLHDSVREKGLVIVPAEYRLDSGEVNFLNAGEIAP